MTLAHHHSLRGDRGRGRRGVAATELALLLPVLCFVCLASIDYARLFYAWSTLADCARNGALCAADSAVATSSGLSTAQQAALVDASNLSPSPTVSSSSGTDSSGTAYVQVTVTYTFKTLVNYPGIPNSTILKRSIRMAVAPD